MVKLFNDLFGLIDVAFLNMFSGGIRPKEEDEDGLDD